LLFSREEIKREEGSRFSGHLEKNGMGKRKEEETKSSAEKGSESIQLNRVPVGVKTLS